MYFFVFSPQNARSEARGCNPTEPTSRSCALLVELFSIKLNESLRIGFKRSNDEAFRRVRQAKIYLAGELLA